MNCYCDDYVDSFKSLAESINNETYTVYGNINKGEDIILKYHGKLVNDDTSNIVISLGYGNLWENKQTLEMKKCAYNDNNIFCIKLKLEKNENINFCFMDNNNNWDLDNSTSYSFKVEDIKETVTKTVADLTIADDENTSKFKLLLHKITDKMLKLFLNIGNVFERPKLNL